MSTARDNVFDRHTVHWHGDHRISVDRKRGVFRPEMGDVVVRQDCGDVLVFVKGKALRMSTPIAVKIGLALTGTGGANFEPDEIVVMDISGVEVQMLPQTAAKIGSAILRKADRADDWQRAFSH